jgi:hypothetical protein
MGHGLWVMVMGGTRFNERAEHLAERLTGSGTRVWGANLHYHRRDAETQRSLEID